jgi:hypothetical protein
MKKIMRIDVLSRDVILEQNIVAPYVQRDIVMSTLEFMVI